MKITVFYDGQYWVGVVEVVEDSKLKAYRHVFGQEPKEEEVLEFVNNQVTCIMDRQQAFVEVHESVEKKINPKRLQRDVAKEMKRQGISTMAQEAVKLQYENNKIENRKISKAQKEEEWERKRDIAVKKAKEKHKGR